MGVKKATVGLAGLLILLVLHGLATGDILLKGYWKLVLILVGFYSLIEMTTAAAAVGFKGVELQNRKSKKMVTFERWCLGLAILSWICVLIFDVYSFVGQHWSPVVSNIFTAISIGIIVKFLDVEWTLMGSDFKKEWWGAVCIGLLISSISAFGIATTPASELLAVSLAKIMFALGISVLFALFSRLIDIQLSKIN